MGRRKTRLALELIRDDKARKVTFRKRKNGLFKKAFELSTLCDVKVCTIVYEKKSEGKLAPPLTFPAKFEEVKEIIDKYKSNSSKIKKVQNLADFYATQTMQVKKEIVKLRNKSYEEKYPTWDDRLNEYSLDQMHELLSNLEAKIQAAHKIHKLMMIDSKKLAIQEIIPPMAFAQSNVDYPPLLAMVDDQNRSNYGSMGMSESGWDQSATASTSWANNNIQYAPSNVSDHKGTTSIWDYDLFGIDAVPLQYGNMEEKPTTFDSNPMQPPYMYDPIFSSAAAAAATTTSQGQQQLSVEHPLDVPPINVGYDEPLSLSLQPSYTDCPVSAASFSFEYQQFATSSQSQSYVDDPVRMFYDNMFQFKQNNVSTYK